MAFQHHGQFLARSLLAGERAARNHRPSSVVPDIEDECSVCHMPVTRYQAKLKGKKGEIFAHLPFDPDNKESAAAEDGVTCSICHQISKEKLGTPRQLQWRIRDRDSRVQKRAP